MPAMPAALLAATLGMGELFRIVFAEELGVRGKRAMQPGSFNLVTLSSPVFDLPTPADVDLGPFRMVGVGAVGQAAALTLSLSKVSGQLMAIDHEVVSLSNLQRYVLTGSGDVDQSKVDLCANHFTGSAVEVIPVRARWNAGMAQEQIPTLVAVDSAEDRIAIQASLPGIIYNAWTQPADVGWSRHEDFGKAPCLACLYWPTHGRPSRHEQIGAAFDQHPLRVLAYLVHPNISVGDPLPPGATPTLPGIEAPPDASDWQLRALLDDIAARAGINGAEMIPWRDYSLAKFYQDGICGGAVLPLGIGSVANEIVVPLAHQSVFAGVMLATQLIVAAVPRLTESRAASIEGRLDILAGLPQVLMRPRSCSAGCLCGDPLFNEVQKAKAAGAARSSTERQEDG